MSSLTEFLEEDEISRNIRELCRKMARERFAVRSAMLERLLLATIRGEKLVLHETRKNTWGSDITYEYKFESPKAD